MASVSLGFYCLYRGPEAAGTALPTLGLCSILLPEHSRLAGTPPGIHPPAVSGAAIWMESWQEVEHHMLAAVPGQLRAV